MKILLSACTHCGEEGHILEADGVCVTCHDVISRTCDGCKGVIGEPGAEPLKKWQDMMLCRDCLKDAKYFAACEGAYRKRKARAEEAL